MQEFLPRSDRASAGERALLLAAGAVGSALLSNYLPGPEISFLEFPILPGVYFGIVLATAVYLWVTRSAVATIAIVVASLLAWIAAVETATHMHQWMTGSLREIAKIAEPFPVELDYLLAVCGVAAGFVGSSIVVFALFGISRTFRVFDNWARAALLGSMAGTLLEFFAEWKGLPIHIGSLLPL